MSTTNEFEETRKLRQAAHQQLLDRFPAWTNAWGSSANRADGLSLGVQVLGHRGEANQPLGFAASCWDDPHKAVFDAAEGRQIRLTALTLEGAMAEADQRWPFSSTATIRARARRDEDDVDRLTEQLETTEALVVSLQQQLSSARARFEHSSAECEKLRRRGLL